MSAAQGRRDFQIALPKSAPLGGGRRRQESQLFLNRGATPSGRRFTPWADRAELGAALDVEPETINL